MKRYIITLHDGTSEIVEAESVDVKYGFTKFWDGEGYPRILSNRVLDDVEELAEGEPVPPQLEDEHGMPVRPLDRLVDLTEQLAELRGDFDRLAERLRMSGTP